MNSEIIRKLNQQNTLDNMLPLTAFSDETKAEELGKQGYIPGFTVESWKAAFPDVDPRHVLCPQTILFPPSLIYYDPEHYICFDTHIFGGMMQFPLRQADGRQMDANRILLERIADGMKDYEEKNYADLLFPMTSEEGGGTAIRILREMLEREEPNPKLYAAFLSVYTLCNCGAHLLGEKALGRLVMCKSEKQKAETKRKLRQFSGDVVTVYRGQASQSTPYEKACSWTTDINKAYFFASWRSAEDSRILTGTVRKDQILDYINDRNEKEVLVLPGAVKKREYGNAPHGICSRISPRRICSAENTGFRRKPWHGTSWRLWTMCMRKPERTTTTRTIPSVSRCWQTTSTVWKSCFR